MTDKLDYLEADLFEQVMAELQRERAVRRRLYPDWVRRGQISEDIANHRLEMLELAIAQLEQLRPVAQGNLFRL